MPAGFSSWMSVENSGPVPELSSESLRQAGDADEEMDGGGSVLVRPGVHRYHTGFPGLVASLTSIQNTLGTVSSMLVAIITGYIVGTTGSFVLALLVAGAMALGGALSYVFLVKSFEPLPLDSAEQPASSLLLLSIFYFLFSFFLRTKRVGLTS